MLRQRLRDEARVVLGGRDLADREIEALGEDAFRELRPVAMVMRTCRPRRCASSRAAAFPTEMSAG